MNETMRKATRTYFGTTVDAQLLDDLQKIQGIRGVKKHQPKMSTLMDDVIREFIENHKDELDSANEYIRGVLPKHEEYLAEKLKDLKYRDPIPDPEDEKLLETVRKIRALSWEEV